MNGWKIIGNKKKKMIPHQTIPNFYLIPDYFTFQSIFFQAYEPIVEKVEQVKSTMLKTEK